MPSMSGNSPRHLKLTASIARTARLAIAGAFAIGRFFRLIE
jgi:hypothetical protein